MTQQRKSISKKIRFEIFKRDSFTCQYCGESAPKVILEVDHIIPIVRGGFNHKINLITSCFNFNRGKSYQSLSDDFLISKQHTKATLVAEIYYLYDILKDKMPSINSYEVLFILQKLLENYNLTAVYELCCDMPNWNSFKKMVDEFWLKD